MTGSKRQTVYINAIVHLSGSRYFLIKETTLIYQCQTTLITKAFTGVTQRKIFQYKSVSGKNTTLLPT